MTPVSGNVFLSGLYMNMILQIAGRAALAGVFLGLGLTLGSVAMAAESAPVATDSAAGTTENNAAAQSQPGDDDKVYATVNGKPVMLGKLNFQSMQLIRERYYHGKVPEGKDEEVRKEVLDALALRILLVEEAERRGFKPDAAEIEQAVARADKKYAGKPEWEERDRLIAELKEVLARNSLVEQLKRAEQAALPEPSPEEVRAYYDQHQDLFTQPERQSLSVILKKVDPSAMLDAWGVALEETRRIYGELKAGADFADMAKKYSDDKSAPNGGNMGYLHRGMLPEALHAAVDKLQPGMLGEPIKGLEGFYIFRLDSREPATVMAFDQVKARAEALFKRDRQEQVWKKLIERLRGAAKIEILMPSGTSAAAAP